MATTRLVSASTSITEPSLGRRVLVGPGLGHLGHRRAGAWIAVGGGVGEIPQTADEVAQLGDPARALAERTGATLDAFRAARRSN